MAEYRSTRSKRARPDDNGPYRKFKQEENDELIDNLPHLDLMGSEDSNMSSNDTDGDKLEWSQKDWMNFIQRCLAYLTNTNPPKELNVYKWERQVVPQEFNESASGIFCYPYKGIFLPSGNLDGRVWKPSQGAKQTGNSLMKRYFYHKDSDGNKIKRQVSWLSHCEDWCFVDYRFDFKGKIKYSDLLIPPGLDFVLLVRLTEQFVSENPHLDPIGDSTSTTPVKSERPMRKQIRTMEPNPNEIKETISINGGMDASQRAISLELASLESNLIVSDLVETYHHHEVHSTDLIISNNTGVPCNPNGQFEWDWNGYSEFQDLIGPLSPLEVPDASESEEGLNKPNGEFFSKFLEAETSLDESSNGSSSANDSVEEDEEDFNHLLKKQKWIESLIEPTPAPSLSTPSNLILSGFDYLLSHLLSYDQIVETICNNICTQLIFNRRFHQRTGIDSKALLVTVQQMPTQTVDLKEFPGKVMGNFFQFLLRCVSPTAIVDDFPPLYCMVCGCKDGHHNEQIHSQFFENLDGVFVTSLKEKATTFYEMIKQVVAFLLKYPNERQAFKRLMAENLHCPFCSGKHGIHDHREHMKWKTAWRYQANPDVPRIPCPTPSETKDLDTVSYTQAGFQFLMNAMPFTIPSFLFSLQNVRSFIDCLVTLWRIINLN